MPGDLRSMIQAGKMGNQSAQMAGIKPGMNPMQNPAVGGMTPPSPMGAQAPMAPPPMEAPPTGGPGGAGAGMGGIPPELANNMDPQLMQILQQLAQLPPEQIIQLIEQIPDEEAQVALLEAAAMVNPGLVEYLSQAQGQPGGAPPQHAMGMPASPMGGPPPGAMGPMAGGPPPGATISGQL